MFFLSKGRNFRSISLNLKTKLSDKNFMKPFAQTPQEPSENFEKIRQKISREENLDEKEFEVLFWHRLYHSNTRQEQEYKDAL